MSLSQPYYRGTPGTATPFLVAVAHDVRVAIKNRVNDSPQGARAFAVDDPDLGDTPFQALVQIIGNQVVHVLGRECVQVQSSVDRDLDRFLVKLGHNRH